MRALIIIGILALVLVGCSSNAQVPQNTQPAQNPYVGGGCNVQSVDIAEEQETIHIPAWVRL